MNQVFLRLKATLRAPFPGRQVALPVGTIVAVFFLFNSVILPLYVHHGSTLAVPNIVGRPLDSARSMLDEEGLQAVQAETRPDPAWPAGTVTNQNPSSGTIVKEGRRVYLTISGGEIEVDVPALRGRTVRDARFALERNGLRLGSSSYVPSATFPENTILDQSITPASRVQKGTELAITVSSGPDTLQIAVPHVVGKSTTEAERMLMGAGLRIGNITLQPNFDLLPNTVVDQFPRPRAMVPRGQAVDLFVVQSGRPSEEFQSPK